MAKRANYSLTMNEGYAQKEVKGEIYGSFGIHKREDGYFALTHIDSGMLVCSAQKKKELVELLDDPEFKEECWKDSTKIEPKDVNRLSKIIGQFYSKKC